ncbi:Prolyl oligopeptidase family protein [Quadrisphaera granulorum]|uniref:Prolyl oligopeptidase family protein n=1 Tax=Quadrisphaera granulorum TaxID=317664 RepID=A0A316A7V9_9ACTN|nr:prolyl oligopeptidase family protein [Quadrisphaera granulorum]SZE96914.1 Prolyl oligopeptidase family protein [Quadrisphaera granulorum]
MLAHPAGCRVLRYGDDPQQVVEVWPAVPGKPARGTAVLVHGGYWRTPWAADLMHSLVPAFTGRGWRVAVPEYRRIGSGGGWPATSDDVAAALAALDEDDGERGRGGPVVLVGHSAGGHLALVHARAADAVVALAPVTDLVRGYAEGIGNGAVAELMGGASPQADPAAYLAASPRQRPWPACPVLVVHGTDDARVPVEHSRDYVATARSDGAPVELVEPASLDHMALIDPAAPHWPAVHTWLATTLPTPP